MGTPHGFKLFIVGTVRDRAALQRLIEAADALNTEAEGVSEAYIAALASIVSTDLEQVYADNYLASLLRIYAIHEDDSVRAMPETEDTIGDIDDVAEFIAILARVMEPRSYLIFVPFRDDAPTFEITNLDFSSPTALRVTSDGTTEPVAVSLAYFAPDGTPLALSLR